MASESDDRPTPSEQVARLYEQAESQAAQASERVVGSKGFGGLLGQMAENTAALTRITNDTLDLMLRNLRLAGRRDVVRLARQLARTEDKLERVLQEVEEMHDQLDEVRRDGRASNRSRRNNGRGSSRSKRSEGTTAAQAKEST